MSTSMEVSNVVYISGKRRKRRDHKQKQNRKIMHKKRDNKKLVLKIKLSISRCAFVEAGKIRVVTDKIPFSRISKIDVRYSRFTRTRGVQVWFTHGKVTIQKCTFTDHLNGVIHVSRVKHFSIIDCTFYNNKNPSEGGCVRVGSCWVALIRHNNFTQCISRDSGGAIYILNPRMQHVVTNNLFTKNRAFKTGGAIFVLIQHLDNKVTLISRSVFAQNRAEAVGQDICGSYIHVHQVRIFAADRWGWTRLQIDGGKIRIGNIQLITVHTNMIKSGITKRGISVTTTDLHIDGKISYMCPKHFNVNTYHTWSKGYRVNEGRIDVYYASFSTSCKSCGANKYTLNTGKVVVFSLLKNRTLDKWRQNKTRETCLPCPPGAICNGNIIPLDNYWGYMVNSTTIIFTQCPQGYCCSSRGTICTSYNTCAQGRAGIMCGSCATGYAQSFVSEECVEKDGIRCNLGGFLIYFVFISFFYTTAFTFLTPILAAIRNFMVSRKRKSDAANDKSDDEDVNDQIRVAAREAAEENPPIPMSAYVISVFFFLQVSALVHIKVPNLTKDKNDMGDGFPNNLFNFANLKFAVSRRLCPMDNLTLPMKESINVALKMCSIFNLIFFLLCFKCAGFFRKVFASGKDDKADVESIGLSSSNNHKELESKEPNGSEKQGYSTEPTENGELESLKLDRDIQLMNEKDYPLSFTSLLKIGFIKLVKLNLTSLFTFTVHMMHCVSIAEGSHLYVYGDYKCYMYWQYFILFGILPILLILPWAFGVSLNLMKEGHISSSTFFSASVCPYLAIGFYAKKWIHGLGEHNPTDDERLCIKTVLEMEEELYHAKRAFLRWPVLQLYRNFTIVIISTFVLNPIYRTIIFIPVFGAFLFHDGNRKPYRHPYLNVLQCLTSGCLLVIAACNIPASMIVMTNALSVPLMSTVVLVCQHVEMAMYAVVPMSFVGWIIWVKWRCTSKELKQE